MKYTQILFLALCCLFNTGWAQNKYGLVIGINKYYKLVNGQKVPDAENSKLKGCVSDAKSIKQLLVTRFGFQPANIKEVYDYQATENNIRNEIKALLAKSQKGDVVAFYYSGHGFAFPHINPKTGTQWAEAICPADFNASNPRNFIEGEELAYWFAQFVDKGVTLTSIFDCCHSNSTVRLQKNKTNLSGLPKILDMSAWVQEPEPETAMSTSIDFREFNSILQRDAWDLQVECDGNGNQEALAAWLNDHGGARAIADTFCPGALSWSYSEVDNYFWECTLYQNYKFIVRDSCGTLDFTQARFMIEDTQDPVLVHPATDTTVMCCGQDYQAILEDWLMRNGGATAVDNCSLSWSHNCTALQKAVLDSTGSISVVFTAADSCHSIITAARFTVEDQSETDKNRISDMELNLVLDFLNKLPLVNITLTDLNIGERIIFHQEMKDQIGKQMDLIVDCKRELLQISPDDSARVARVPDTLVNKKDLEAIQGKPLMGQLAKSIDSLLVLIDPLFKDRDHLGLTLTYKTFTQPPLDFLIPVSDQQDYAGFLKSGGKDIAKEALITADPKLFTYVPFEHRPPSKIPGSRFLFMSATNDIQQGVEKKDENKQSRGAFTKALITVMRDNPATLSSLEIFEKVKKQLADRYIPHTPSMSVAASRRKDNLFGVDPKIIKEKYTITCIRKNSDGTLSFKQGSLSGLAVGNTLRAIKDSFDINIIKVWPDSAVAKLKATTGIVNAGFRTMIKYEGMDFKLIDGHTISKPLVQVYIPNDSCSIAQQETLVNKYIKPLLNDPDLVPFDSASNSCTKIFMRGNKFTTIKLGKETPPYVQDKLTAEINKVNDYFIYLPTPTEITAALKNSCSKDQNIQLVKDPLSSNLSFYCTYSKPLGGVVYVVTDQEITGKRRANTVHTVPYYYFPAVDKKTKTNLSPQQIADNLYRTLLLYAARYGWLNKSPKK